MHLLKIELLIDVERLGGFPQHQLELAKSPPPYATVASLNRKMTLKHLSQFGSDRSSGSNNAMSVSLLGSSWSIAVNLLQPKILCLV